MVLIDGYQTALSTVCLCAKQLGCRWGVYGREVCGCVLKGTRRLLHSLPVVNTHTQNGANKQNRIGQVKVELKLQLRLADTLLANC